MARRLVLEELFAANGPVSAERIAGQIAHRGTTFEVSSVYRNLERLEAMGVVRHVHLGHGPGLYSLVGRGEREFLACERCNRVLSVEPSRLDSIRADIRERFGYEARFTHFPITGLCPDCARAPEAESRKGGTTMSDEGSGHSHSQPHSHEHAHDGETHSHAHTSHDHEHTEHEHEHSHGDLIHSHPHAHEKGLEDSHEHQHSPATEA